MGEVERTPKAGRSQSDLAEGAANDGERKRGFGMDGLDECHIWKGVDEYDLDDFAGQVENSER